MTQPQANQHLLDTGYTQDEIDYAFECCAPMATILSQLDDVQETEPIQESETQEIVEQPYPYFKRRHKMLEDHDTVEFLGLENFTLKTTENVQRIGDGIVARPPIVLERS